MRFSPGDEVVVTTLANKRGTIVDAAPDGRYRVRVENVTIACRESDLDDPPRTGKRKKKASGTPAPAPSTGVSSASARIDLHGLTVDDALAALMDAVESAIDRGADRLEVVHGKGTGRVKHAVHQRLAELPAVKAFKLDERNRGITWVFL